MIVSDAYLMFYASLVRELIDALNREAASGLIPHNALSLITILDRHTRTLERHIRNAHTQPPSQQ